MCQLCDGLESVAEGDFEGLAVYFGLRGSAIILKLVAVGGDEVGAILNAEIVLLIFEAYTDLPTHLETVPGVVAVAHVLLAVAVEVNPFRFFVAIEVIFAEVGVHIILNFGYEIELEVDTNIRSDFKVVAYVEAVNEVNGHAKVDVGHLLFVLEPVAIIFKLLADFLGSEAEIKASADFHKHVFSNAEAMSVVDAETIEAAAFSLVGIGVVLVHRLVLPVVGKSNTIVAFCIGYGSAGYEHSSCQNHFFHNSVSIKDFDEYWSIYYNVSNSTYTAYVNCVCAKLNKFLRL